MTGRELRDRIEDQEQCEVMVEVTDMQGGRLLVPVKDADRFVIFERDEPILDGLDGLPPPPRPVGMPPPPPPVRVVVRLHT